MMFNMLTSNEVMSRSFTPTSLRRGYDEREVDDFLDQVVETLRYYEQGGRPGPQAPASPTPPAPESLGSRAARWLRGDSKP
jgi:DivIVA domain-containing protein